MVRLSRLVILRILLLMCNPLSLLSLLLLLGHLVIKMHNFRVTHLFKVFVACVVKEPLLPHPDQEHRDKVQNQGRIRLCQLPTKILRIMLTGQQIDDLPREDNRKGQACRIMHQLVIFVPMHLFFIQNARRIPLDVVE